MAYAPSKRARPDPSSPATVNGKKPIDPGLPNEIYQCVDQETNEPSELCLWTIKLFGTPLPGGGPQFAAEMTSRMPMLGCKYDGEREVTGRRGSFTAPPVLRIQVKTSGGYEKAKAILREMAPSLRLKPTDFA